jgi:Protein of unknown function (DUF3606)
MHSINASELIAIDVNQDREVRYWTERLAIDEFALRTAIADVGPLVRDVADAVGCGARA